MPASFRPATAQDVDVVTDLFLAIDEHYWGEAPDRDAMRRHVAEKVLAADADGRVVIAEDGGRPVGIATYAVLYPSPGEAGTFYMKDLFVVAAARGTGLGETFMRHLAQLALDAGCTRFDWTAETSNPGAVAFYDRIGAARVENKVYFRLTGGEIAAMANPETDG